MIRREDRTVFEFNATGRRVFINGLGDFNPGDRHQRGRRQVG